MVLFTGSKLLLTTLVIAWFSLVTQTEKRSLGYVTKLKNITALKTLQKWEAYDQVMTLVLLG